MSDIAELRTALCQASIALKSDDEEYAAGVLEEVNLTLERTKDLEDIKARARRKDLPPAFAMMYPKLRMVALDLGYALALHGSMSRDFDLVAVPWVELAAPAAELAEAIRDAIDGHTLDEDGNNPSTRPHGRLSWSIMLGKYGAYVDLSVMPINPGPQ